MGSDEGRATSVAESGFLTAGETDADVEVADEELWVDVGWEADALFSCGNEEDRLWCRD